jgi:hypothetical protein
VREEKRKAKREVKARNSIVGRGTYYTREAREEVIREK